MSDSGGGETSRTRAILLAMGYSEIIRVASTLATPLPPPANTKVQNDLVLGFLDRFVKGEADGFPRSVMKRHPDLIRLDRTKGKTR
jgi:hypothetical protein